MNNWIPQNNAGKTERYQNGPWRAAVGFTDHFWWTANNTISNDVSQVFGDADSLAEAKEEAMATLKRWGMKDESITS